ncbi:hypothetical protein FOCC_FOCC000841 [Frankliniella occidentalis]|uniref:Protein lines n=1 Tax=Frankliniella occidentalis TaxID=133901 RepID=A0A6J1SEM2_FRAOC|nr:protein lines [Frankliniella occidentalis]KAE8752369.1 hypothetical protein FOCC_FOCC000841 [Frankliniella occidentalis]
MVLGKGKAVSPLLSMAEPVKKRLRVAGNDEAEEEDAAAHDLMEFQQNLLNQCLCCMSESSLRRPFRDKPSDTSWTRDRILQFVGSIQLLCEVAMKQTTRGFVCSRIGDVCDALTRNEHGLIDRLVELSSHSDRFVCFAASRALSAFLLVSKTNVDPFWLQNLADNALSTSQPRQMCFSLDVIRRIVEYKECDGHVLEERGGPEDKPPSSCNILMTDPEADCSQVKSLCVKVLEAKWPALVTKFDSLVSSYASEHEATVVTFLELWEALISVKANLSVADTKPFYAHLDNVVMLLAPSVPPVVWKSILNLLNEVLCYGSTLALQDVLAEEPCALAHLVVRGVKDSRLLDGLPYRGGSGRFGGGVGDGDRPLLKKMVLLVLKAVAVTVKETRCDSSDSSLSSDADEADADMALIERSIREVLRKLDQCVKALVPFHPETPVAQWVVQLFADQDDALVESMVCCLDTAVGLVYRDSVVQSDTTLRRVLSPAATFIQFVRAVSHEPDVLLDLLVSNETCFLLYLLRTLKFVRRNWEEFMQECAGELDNVMTVLIRLRLAIDRLVSKDLFPYNIGPVLRLLEKCESMYEGNTQ